MRQKSEKINFCDQCAYMKYKEWAKKTRPSKTLKCSRSKTSRPKNLNSLHHVDVMRSTWCELFSFLCLIVLDLEHVKVLGDLIFVCSPLIHTLWFALYFFVYTTLTLLTSLQWMSVGNFTKIPGKPKSLRRQWKV